MVRIPLLAAASILVVLASLAARAGDEPPVSVKPENSGATADAAADLLNPPGSDRYGPKVDWRTVPPWQQMSFFGIRSKGRVFIYVVDCSGSMSDDGRLIRAKRELRRSIMNLRFPQRYQVIFYNDRPLSMPGHIPQSADMNIKTTTMNWLRSIEADGETDPRGAMSMALSVKPDAVFLLSDGEFPEGSAESIAKSNTRKVPIHCIDLSGGAAGSQLQRIAKDSGGDYTLQP
ncbi:MAG TPA: vWA domain-containing protein [Isosphaeraceae bacterium]|jgi:hypothetical protein|nr:vWA domain-containing protein [Isosphaeraceae bacterium]